MNPYIFVHFQWAQLNLQPRLRSSLWRWWQGKLAVRSAISDVTDITWSPFWPTVRDTKTASKIVGRVGCVVESKISCWNINILGQSQSIPRGPQRPLFSGTRLTFEDLVTTPISISETLSYHTWPIHFTCIYSFLVFYIFQYLSCMSRREVMCGITLFDWIQSSSFVVLVCSLAAVETRKTALRSLLRMRCMWVKKTTEVVNVKPKDRQKTSRLL